MTGKPIVRRARASRDLEAAADFYFAEGGQALELRFIDAVERAFGLIANTPGIGSPRYALVSKHAELRCMPIGRFPHLVFYVERPDRIEVLRILHGSRDIPAVLREPAGEGNV